MTKKAFIFPGQGCQYLGMGAALYEKYPLVKQAFDTAKSVTAKDIAALCFNGPEEALAQTINAQVAIFTLSMGIFLQLKEACIMPDMVAGFSLGEYTALCAAGVFSLEDGIRIVAKRGELMQKASSESPGAMVAVIGLENQQVEEICREIQEKTGEFIQPVNYNCPKQIVISGTIAGANAAAEACLAVGAMKAVPLNTSGPFHTKLIADAAAEMKTFLEGFSFATPNLPVYTNLTGNLLEPTVNLPLHLQQHMISPVKWQTTIEAMLEAMREQEITVFAETGPGKTLSGFNRRINRQIKTFPLEELTQMEEFIATFA